MIPQESFEAHTRQQRSPIRVYALTEDISQKVAQGQCVSLTMTRMRKRKVPKLSSENMRGKRDRVPQVVFVGF